jgi:hypothetical protein
MLKIYGQYNGIQKLAQRKPSQDNLTITHLKIELKTKHSLTHKHVKLGETICEC